MAASVASSSSLSARSCALSCDGNPPVAHATRYPAVEVVKDGEAKQKATAAHDAGVKAVDFMLKNPDRSVDIWSHVEQLMKKDEAGNVAECWSSQYRKVWRIPGEWWAQWLGNNGGEDLPATVVQKMFAKDERSVKVVGLFVCCLSSGTKLPPVLLNKQLAARVFAKLAKEKKRWEHVRKAININDGVVDWSKLAAYKVHWGEDDCADKVEHLTGAVVDIAAGMRFAKSFKLRDPASDRDCCAVGPGDCSISLHKLFPLGVGPHTVMIGEDGAALTKMGEAEQKALEVEQESVRAGQLENVVECQNTLEKLAQKRAAFEAGRLKVKAKRAKVEANFS